MCVCVCTCMYVSMHACMSCMYACMYAGYAYVLSIQCESLPPLRILSRQCESSPNRQSRVDALATCLCPQPLAWGGTTQSPWQGYLPGDSFTGQCAGMSREAARQRRLGQENGAPPARRSSFCMSCMYACMSCMHVSRVCMHVCKLCLCMHVPYFCSNSVREPSPFKYVKSSVREQPQPAESGRCLSDMPVPATTRVGRDDPEPLAGVPARGQLHGSMCRHVAGGRPAASVGARISKRIECMDRCSIPFSLTLLS